MTMAAPITLDHLIQTDPTVQYYFKTHLGRQQPSQLALQLLREAIRHREGRSNQTHYHVAYVKHNRFLSPSQKQEVTDKVTHIIPQQQHPQKIHAKPKLKHEENQPLESKSWNEIETKEEIKSREVISSHKREIADKQTQVGVIHEPQNEENKREESEKYLSPKQKSKVQPAQKQHPNRPKQYASQNAIKHSQPQAPTRDYYSPKVKDSQGHLNIQSNYRSKEGFDMGSPKVGRQDYGKVESRIKFLIDRDKQSKKMEKILEAQTQKIERLEQRQQKLLLLQYEQEKQMLRTNHLQKYIEKALSDSDSDSSEQQQQDKNPLSAISLKLDAINQRAESVRDHQHALFADLERMRDKTYKMNSQPIYPISSSDEGEESQYQ